MSEMIERVARAIAKAEALRPDTFSYEGFAVHSPDAHARVLEAARAAIEAMREPSDDVREIMNGHAANGFVNWDDYHEAMIDAALNSPEAGR